MKQLVVRVLVSLAIIRGAVAAAPASADPDKVDRWFGLARVWAEAKFFHPVMFQRQIDWDGALIKAIPEVEAATDAPSYRAAITRLLAVLGDPRTGVEPAMKPAEPAATWKDWVAKDVLVLNARPPGDLADYIAIRRLARDAKPEVAKAKVVVLDVRGLPDDDDGVLGSLIDSLPATQTWPLIRTIQHRGFRSQGETNRDTYSTSWEITAGAPTVGAPTGPSHVVVIVDPDQPPPLFVVALWTSGHATLVSSRALDDNAAAPTKRVELPYGIVARIRVADVLLPADRAFTADVVTGPGVDPRTRAIEIASRIAAGGAPPHAAERRLAAGSELRIRDDDDGPTTGLPSRERRLLAAFRIWAVIEYFHGVQRLNLGWHDWHDPGHPLRKALPQLDAVTDVQGYLDALHEMLVPLRDGHTGVYNPSERAERAVTAVYWRRVDGKLVAGGFRDPAQAQAAGIALGDELVSVDGVPIETAFAAKLRVNTGGTEEARQQWALAVVDRGPRGSSVDDEVRSPNGTLHRVSLRRDFDYDHNFWAHQGPHFQVLPGNLGYADLTRLTGAEVDAMFEALGKTSAIIFDMRGYPRGTGWLIGARLNTRGASALSEIRTPVITAGSTDGRLTRRTLQQVPTTDKPLYRGKIVVLIDDRAISSAEHTCLILETTGRAKFVGSPTAGTNGEETYVKIPGGFELRFTGMEILHADGRQLQLVGIQPDVTVRPTLRGLRAGKDEVLDRAVRYLQSGH